MPQKAHSRRVVVKARVVQLGKANGKPVERLAHMLAKRAARLHLGYLEREGVDWDGHAGALYDAQGRVDRRIFNDELPGEEHQFRLIVSPEDGHALDLRAFVQEYMDQVQQDLGRELLWAAVDHHNTDQPHAHIVIRGIDARGAKVRLEPDYVSHGLRRRAEELVTERLGPRPERTRVDQLRRELELERYTSLDRQLERRARGDSAFRVDKHGRHDQQLGGIFRDRLLMLESLGLASLVGPSQWRLDPNLRARLQVMGREAEAMRVMRPVVRAARYRVIDRTEERNDGAPELDRGAFAVVRWKGLDEDGRFVAIIETTAGVAYHLPVTNRVAASIRVGQVLDVKRAVDKDERIEEVAAANGRRYDVDSLPEEYRDAYRKRLEQLERLQLAKRAGKSAWILKEDFRNLAAQASERSVALDARIEAAVAANGRRYDLEDIPLEQRDAARARLEELERQQLARREGKSAWIVQHRFQTQARGTKPQAYWQMLSLVSDTQPLGVQSRFPGLVWLDHIPPDLTAPTGFGKEVRDALAERHDYLRAVGLDPQSKNLRWELRDLQQSELERSLVASTGRISVRAHDGFRGVAHIHRGSNGQAFAVVHSKDAFAVVPASSKQASLDGQDVQLQIGAKGRVQVLPSNEYPAQHQKRQAQALAQAAAVAPHAVRCHVVGAEPLGDGAAELDTGVGGIVRWVGTDARGSTHAVVESLSGAAYYVPLSGRVASATRAGQIVELQRAPDADAPLRETALGREGVCDLVAAAEGARPAMRRRLEELERLRLATRVGEAKWQLSESFLRSKAPSPPRPIWIRASDQSLEEQTKNPGYVWLDRARGSELAASGFGATVREALADRDAYLRGLGVDSASKHLRWKLRDLQQLQLGEALEAAGNARRVAVRNGFEGTVHLHQATNGERFVEVRAPNGRFALLPASRGAETLLGKSVRVDLCERGRPKLQPLDRGLER